MVGPDDDALVRRYTFWARTYGEFELQEIADNVRGIVDGSYSGARVAQRSLAAAARRLARVSSIVERMTSVAIAE